MEPTIPAFKRTKTVHALDSAATVIGRNISSGIKILLFFHFNAIYCIKVVGPLVTCTLDFAKYNEGKKYTGVVRGISGPKRDEGGESCIMRSFLSSTLRQIQFE
jgi:hypothetical protein